MADRRTASLPWFRVFAADWESLTAPLSPSATGCFLRLVLAIWRSPTRSLADKDVQLARICRCSLKSWLSGGVRAELTPLFLINDGRWRFLLIEDEFDVAMARSDAARGGANTRWKPPRLMWKTRGKT